jgi:hypothetical protein
VEAQVYISSAEPDATASVGGILGFELLLREFEEVLGISAPCLEVKSLFQFLFISKRKIRGVQIRRFFPLKT